MVMCCLHRERLCSRCAIAISSFHCDCARLLVIQFVLNRKRSRLWIDCERRLFVCTNDREGDVVSAVRITGGYISDETVVFTDYIGRTASATARSDLRWLV